MNRYNKGASILAAAVTLALIVLMLVNHVTEQRISDARQQMMLDNLSAVLPEGPFDQNPVDSVRQHVVAALGGEQELDVYTAYRNTRPVAAVLELIAPDGYSGNIRMLLGLLADGTVVAVRVIAHKETPGLGDRIEYRKSQWISQFDGQAIEASEPLDWGTRQSDGQFDALSGATITSAAIIRSIHRALLWFHEHSDEVFRR